MRKFKEIVSYIDPHTIVDNIYETTLCVHDKPYMPGTLVELINNKVVQTNSKTTNVYGVILNTYNETQSIVVTSGITYCLCKSSKYKIGDYIRVSDLYGVASKYTSDNRFFKLNDNIKKLDAFAIVEDNIDLRTVYIGLVKIRILNVSSI